ncbi:MAG: hypothetical protein ACTSU7_07200 [Candidatus Heimdallarchaeaceae archaeon]
MKPVEETTAPNITKEVLKVGGIVFLIAAILPIIHTIYFLVKILPPVLENGIIRNGYGEWQFGIDIGFLITDWLVIVIPLVVPAMICKRVLYTNYKPATFLIPLLTLVLVIAMVFVGIAITGEFSTLWS